MGLGRWKETAGSREAVERTVAALLFRKIVCSPAHDPVDEIQSQFPDDREAPPVDRVIREARQSTVGTRCAVVGTLQAGEGKNYEV